MGRRRKTLTKEEAEKDMEEIRNDYSVLLGIPKEDVRCAKCDSNIEGGYCVSHGVWADDNKCCFWFSLRR